MKTIFRTSQGIDFQITWAGTFTAGYGHRELKFDITLRTGEANEFSVTTSNMPDYDKANELEGQERYEAFYKLVESKLEDEISEWVLELDNKAISNLPFITSTAKDYDMSIEQVKSFYNLYSDDLLLFYEELEDFINLRSIS